MARKKIKRSFVYNETISKNCPGALSNPNQSVLCRIGAHKVNITRGSKLDYYGNPVYTATYINKDGSYGQSYKTNGSCRMAVKGVLNKEKVDVKFSKEELRKQKILNDKMKRATETRQFIKDYERNNRW